MRSKFLGIIGAVAMLAACETAPEQSATSNNSGAKEAAPAAAPMSGPEMGSVKDFVVNVGDRVYFGFDEFALSGEARAVLDKQAAWLQKYPGVRIAVEGHCDERGTREYNLALGERRAVAVKDYLTALGVAEARIQTISYGKERPVAIGHTEEDWAQNRRGVTSIVSGAGS